MGIDGGLLKRRGSAPAVEQGPNAFVCTVQVDDFDATAAAIEAAGGRVVLPKRALTGMAWQGYFLDLLGWRDDWGYANLGVLFALVLSFAVTWFARAGRIRRQEQG